MIALGIFIGFVLAIVVGAIILFFEGDVDPKDAEHARKEAAGKLLRDLLMLADIDSTVNLPPQLKKRIETWLVGGDERYHELWLRSGGQYSTNLGEYRDVAKLIDELVHPKDLNGDIPLLPSTIQVRAQSWLVGHRKALTGS